MSPSYTWLCSSNTDTVLPLLIPLDDVKGPGRMRKSHLQASRLEFREQNDSRNTVTGEYCIVKKVKKVSVSRAEPNPSRAMWVRLGNAEHGSQLERLSDIIV